MSVLKAGSYSADFENIILNGLALCGIHPGGKVVLVKPNLVEYDPGAPIHTHAAVLAGCIAALEKLGATVIVGEGPGHRRDTLEMATAAGYKQAVPRFESSFRDLNLDDVERVHDFCGERDFYFPRTALACDLIVSLARMKTHHWAGATLSMKNLFGLVPGAVYGWPKNKLHFLGLDQSIAALYHRFPKAIGIVDGVVGMEGNGPIQGQPKQTGAIIVGRDLAAVDMACCRLMGISSERVSYLQKLSDDTGISPASILDREKDRELSP